MDVQNFQTDSFVLEEVPQDFCQVSETNATPLNIKFDVNNSFVHQIKSDSIVPDNNQTDPQITVKNNTSFENGFQIVNFEGLSFNNVSITEQDEWNKKKTIQSYYSNQFDSPLIDPLQSFSKVHSQPQPDSAPILKQTTVMKSSQQSKQSSLNRRENSLIVSNIAILQNDIKDKQIEEQYEEQLDEMIPLLQKQQATIKNAEYLIEKCRYDEASIILQLCFQLTQKALVCVPPKDLELKYTVFCVRALVMDANIMRKTGNYFESTGLFVRCTKLFKINDPDTLGKIYQECARNSLLVKKLQDSIDFFIKALKVYERVKWKLDIASVLVQLGEVYAILSSHEDAKKLCYEAISIFKKRLPETDIRIAEAYHTLGFVFFVDKDYEMAVEFYSKSLKAKIVLYGEGGHISMVRTYNLMGTSAWNKRVGRLRAMIVGCRSMVIESDKPEQGFAQLLNNLGVAYIDKGLLDSAQKCFDRAMEMSHVFKYFSQQKIQKNKKLLK